MLSTLYLNISFTAWWQGKKDIDEEFVNIRINTRNLLVTKTSMFYKLDSQV